jgi:hypothetical protein
MIETATQKASGGTAEKPKAHKTDGTKFLTPQQLGSRWSMHEESIRRMIRQRRIESVIIARRRLVPITEVERIEAEGRIARAA